MYLNSAVMIMIKFVTMFIDYAELMAEDEVLMSMQDWLEQTNQFLRNNRREVLEGKGNISHDMAMKKLKRSTKYFESNIIRSTFQSLIIVVQLSRHKFNIFIMNRYM